MRRSTSESSHIASEHISCLEAKAAADEALAIAASKRNTIAGRHKQKPTGASDQDTITDTGNKSNKDEELQSQGGRVDNARILSLNDSRLNTPREPHKEQDDFLFNDDEDHGTNAEVSMISGLSMESSFAFSSATAGVSADPNAENRPGRGLQINDLESSIMSRVSW